MFNKQMKKFTAIGLSAALALGGTAAVNTIAARAEEENRTTLALAEEDTEKETEAAEEAAEETEEVFETLETTKTEEKAISAIDISDVVENTMPSIVSITERSIKEVENYFYGHQEIEVEGAGSGIIIAQNDTELLIATNNHVVADAKELTVCFTADMEDKDHLLAPAVVKGTSSKYDLAVIAVNLKDIHKDVLGQLRIATLGKSANLKVGEASIVIGNALGDGLTVTTGIISALEREITTEAGTFKELQTDAAVNFGCSGGAILNAKGEVIGITSAKATINDAESMGYGIPIDTAVPVLAELINRETRNKVDNHGYLGITVVPVSEEAMQMYNMPAGAFVYEVNEDSAAAAAGIQKGDIITKFDGIDIESSDKLVDTIGFYEVGETVTVEIMTADNGAYKAKEVEITLQEGPSTQEDEADAQEDNQEDQEDQEDKSEDKEDEPLDEDERSEVWPYGDGDDPFGFDDFGQFFFGDGYGRGNGNGNF